MTDWRKGLLGEVTLHTPSVVGADPLHWPGYEPRAAVRWGRGTIAGAPAAICAWDFSVYGGSYGVAETQALEAAVDAAIAARVPMITWVRSGGTRLQEGMGALVGIPRSLLALRRLSRAGLAHISIADQPTTGGVWVGITSGADLRVGIAGATVGFSGPRVVAAVTGRPVLPGEHTAESAYRAGLLDAVVTPGPDTSEWVGRALRAVSGAPVNPSQAEPAKVEGVKCASERSDPAETWTAERSDPAKPWTAARDGWAHVRASRSMDRPDGTQILDSMLDEPGVDLHGAEAEQDRTVRATIGRLGGAPTVVLALAARRGQRPGPAGYELAIRAVRLAGRLGLPLVTLVDTPGADPGPDSERGGIAPAIGGLMDAVLACPAPTVAVVHGEGGSGGALAAAVTDRVLLRPHAWFAAMAPEGAAQALKIDVREAAERGGLTPSRLLAHGVADEVVTTDSELPAVVRAHLAELEATDPTGRMTARERRWTGAG